MLYEYVQKAREAGITIPILPGILPIYNFTKVQEMAEACGTSIPETIRVAFLCREVCGSTEMEIAAEILKAQVSDLACAGHEAIHIYTLNRVPLAQVASETFLKTHEGLSSQRQVA